MSQAPKQNDTALPTREYSHLAVSIPIKAGGCYLDARIEAGGGYVE